MCLNLFLNIDIFSSTVGDQIFIHHEVVHLKIERTKDMYMQYIQCLYFCVVFDLDILVTWKNSESNQYVRSNKMKVGPFHFFRIWHSK